MVEGLWGEGTSDGPLPRLVLVLVALAVLEMAVVMASDTWKALRRGTMLVGGALAGLVALGVFIEVECD